MRTVILVGLALAGTASAFAPLGAVPRVARRSLALSPSMAVARKDSYEITYSLRPTPFFPRPLAWPHPAAQGPDSGWGLYISVWWQGSRENWRRRGARVVRECCVQKQRK